MDQEISRELWKGLIPIEFSMEVSDIASNSYVDSHFLLAPRFGYLHEITKETVIHFQNKAIEISSLVWYEADGIELKHYLPIGVLYDHYHYVQNSLRRKQSDCFRPWKIIIHFQRPIHGPLTVVPASETQRTFFHTLKQALHQLYGSTSHFNLLTIENQTTLWNSINQSDFSQYATLLSILSPNTETIKNIPIRILTIDPANPSLFHVRQRLSKAHLESKTEEIGPERGLLQVLVEDYQIINIESFHVIVQGVELQQLENIPIKSFYQLMRHGDFYLYILVLPRS